MKAAAEVGCITPFTSTTVKASLGPRYRVCRGVVYVRAAKEIYTNHVYNQMLMNRTDVSIV